MKKRQIQKAFTLAEVLTTLAIIGIVAALTIPTLISNYQEKQTVTKIYNKLQRIIFFHHFIRLYFLCYNLYMKILGIDPGMAIVGYCIADFDGENVKLLHSGSIQTSKDDRESKRLLEIFNDLKSLIEKYRPDQAAIEKLFYFKNQRTVMPVAHARGVILAALEEFQIPIYEYTPMEVKQVLTGYGRADKKEVEHMVKLTLGLESLPKLDDTVDSIAIAICHTRSVYE